MIQLANSSDEVIFGYFTNLLNDLPRIGVALYHFLSVLPPPEAIIKNVYVTCGLNYDSRLSNSSTSGS